jgi:hypothetical protein
MVIDSTFSMYGTPLANAKQAANNFLLQTTRPIKTTGVSWYFYLMATTYISATTRIRHRRLHPTPSA